jgi:hypothetical protein
MPSAIAPLDTITTRALRRERRHLAAPVADRIGVDAAAFVGDEARADLDDDAAAFFSARSWCARRDASALWQRGVDRSKRGSGRRHDVLQLDTCS